MTTTKPPASEFSGEFMQAMLNRVAVGFFQYGPVAQAQTDHLKNARHRLDQYEKTGNTEFLIDAANFAMFEFMAPGIPGASFKATDHTDSPGIILAGSSRPRKGVNNRGERKGF